jgi:hypothetical protein
MLHFTVNLDCRKLRTEYLAGEKYLVAPVVLMTPDVHEGSKGPLLYRKRELSDYAPAWNHKPIVLNHPAKGIACKQDFLNQYSMGILLETGFQRGKQRAEAWFNERRTATVSPQTLGKLKRKEMMEVSTGLFVDQKGGPGKHNGKRYTAIAANHKPDHLAVLTDSEGACSIKDGGGLFQLNAKRKSRLHKYIDKQVEQVVGKKLKPSTQEYVMVKNRKITKKAFVQKLIKNEHTAFEEKDRKWLMGLDPKQLQKLAPKKGKHVFNSDKELEKVVNERLEDHIAELNRKRRKRERKKALQRSNEKDVAANKRKKHGPDDDDEDDDDGDGESPARNNKRRKTNGKSTRKSLEHFMRNSCPTELRPVFNQALRAAAVEENRLIKKIVANKAMKFKAKDLKKLAGKLGDDYMDHLRRLARMAKNAAGEDEDENVSYFGAAVPVSNNHGNEEDEDEYLPLPTYNKSFAPDLKLIPAGMGDDEDEDSMDDNE